MAKQKKDKRTNNDLQNITQKTKDRAPRTPLKTGGELRCSGTCLFSPEECVNHIDRYFCDSTGIFFS